MLDVLTCTLSVALAVAASAFPAGERLAGRVVDDDGSPVPRAEVVLVRGDGGVAASARSGTDGGYTFEDVPSDGPYEVRGRRTGVGTGVQEDVAADALTLPDLVLRGAGVLRGRVIGPSGAPAPRRGLVAVSEEFLRSGEVDPLDRWISTDWHPSKRAWRVERDDGLALGLGRSDAEGRFLVSGLRPGRYLLLGPSFDDARLRRSDRWLVTMGPEEVTVRAELTRLVVEVARRPARRAAARLGPVECYQTTAAGDRRLAVRGRSQRGHLVDGPAIFWLVPGDYVIQTTFPPGPGEPPSTPARVATRRVVVPDGKEVVHERLVEPAPGRPTGRLRVDVAGGAPGIEGFRLCDPDTGVSLGGDGDDAPLPAGRDVEVPVGSHLVELVAMGAARWRGRATVEDGRLAHVTATVSAPSPLALTVSAGGEVGAAAESAPRGLGILAVLVGDDGGPARLLTWRTPGAPPGAEISPWLVPGVPVEASRPLPPGSYRLELLHHGAPAGSTPFEARPGETTALTVSL